MSGAHARPELLASPDWLAENLGRPEVRILDVRWRPDGASRVVFNDGHVPGATHLDWRAALTDAEAPDGTLLLAPPDQVAAALAGAGIGNGTTVVVYDDTASLYAARTWWSLRACGLDSVRILDGGFGAWLASGRSGLARRARAPPRHVHAAGPAPPPPHRQRRPGPRRLPGRPLPGCPHAGRVPRLRRERPAPGSYPGRGEPARRGDDGSGNGPLPRRRGAARAAVGRRRVAGAPRSSATTARASGQPSSRSCSP